MAYTDEQQEIVRQLRFYYEITPNKIRFDENNRVITDGFVQLLMGTSELQVEFGEVNNSFSAENKGLRTLRGSPAKVSGYFEVARNKLSTLEGGPKFVGGDYFCYRNNLTSLVGAPEKIGGHFGIYNNPLSSLEGMPKEIGHSIHLSYKPNLPLLRTLVAPIVELTIGTQVVSWDRILLCQDILNKYAGEGKRGAIRCQKELIAAGFEGNARW